MRLYNNPWMAIAYLLGKGTQDAKNKIQNTINEREKKKELESAISYFSIDEEKRKRRNKISKKLERGELYGINQMSRMWERYIIRC